MTHSRASEANRLRALSPEMERQNNNRRIRMRVMSDLPEEMIEEILSRLPVKSLLRFRCVSKAWRALIGSKRFMTKQLMDSKRDTTLSHHRALLCPNYLWKQFEFWECPLLSLFCKPEINSVESNFATNRNLPIHTLRLMGSCNGLVCILLNLEEFVLWNPSTRISKKLSIYIPRVPWGYGFGCDEWSGDYKVVVIFFNQDSAMYSLKSDSWKKIRNAWDLDRYLHGRGLLESGKLLWDTRQEAVGRKKVGFNLKREVFEIVDDQQPCYRSLKGLEVVILDESVETSPSLIECINSGGGLMNIRNLRIVDHTSPTTSTLTYDQVAIYIESLETLDN